LRAGAILIEEGRLYRVYDGLGIRKRLVDIRDFCSRRWILGKAHRLSTKGVDR
jgi:hypothetical protein